MRKLLIVAVLFLALVALAAPARKARAAEIAELSGGDACTRAQVRTRETFRMAVSLCIDFGGAICAAAIDEYYVAAGDEELACNPMPYA